MKMIKNWLKVKLCGAELLELASLKRNIIDLKTWCSHIPVARECGKWLESKDGKTYPSQLKGAHGCIDDFRYYLESESLALNNRKSYREGGRTSGRTFRVVLGAVLRCSEFLPTDKQTVILVGADGKHCEYLMQMVLMVTHSCLTNVKKELEDSVILPNGSRILVRAKGSSLWQKSRGHKTCDQNVFFDHYALDGRHD